MTKQNWTHETKDSLNIIVESEFKSMGSLQPGHICDKLIIHILVMFFLKITGRFIVESLVS